MERVTEELTRVADPMTLWTSLSSHGLPSSSPPLVWSAVPCLSAGWLLSFYVERQVSSKRLRSQHEPVKHSVDLQLFFPLVDVSSTSLPKRPDYAQNCDVYSIILLENYLRVGQSLAFLASWGSGDTFSGTPNPWMSCGGRASALETGHQAGMEGAE